MSMKHGEDVQGRQEQVQHCWEEILPRGLCEPQGCAEVLVFPFCNPGNCSSEVQQVSDFLCDTEALGLPLRCIPGMHRGPGSGPGVIPKQII